jgi:NAD(P)-dependent dehydrogenase (short-subunit alcohol dehydrogenase family)
VALVTGVRGRPGRATAIALARAGADVPLEARNAKEPEDANLTRRDVTLFGRRGYATFRARVLGEPARRPRSPWWLPPS